MASQPQPREKLQELGISNLTDTELVSLILGSGTKQFPVSKVAQIILKRFNLPALATINSSDLLLLNGIGLAQASRLLACIEFGKRLFTKPAATIISNSSNVLEQAVSIQSHQREHLIALYLNARQELLSKDVVSIGGLNYTHINPRDIFTKAVILPAAYIILVHNHPSGNPKPSQDDLEVTERIEAAGQLLGIAIIDHVIVSTHGYYSFKEEGLL